MVPAKQTKGQWALRNDHANDSSSDSDSSDDIKLPSVKLLASKYNSLKPKNVAVNQSSVRPVTLKKPVGLTMTNGFKNTNEVKPPVPEFKLGASKDDYFLRSYSSTSDVDDNVFHSLNIVSPTTAAVNRNVVQKSKIPVVAPLNDKTVIVIKKEVQNDGPPNKNTTESKPFDSGKETSNVIFGVALRPTNKISWGVKQKRQPSVEDEGQVVAKQITLVEAVPVVQPAAPIVSPVAPDAQKTVPPNSSSSPHTNLQKTSGIKEKIRAQKLGNKNVVRYGSHSDLTQTDLEFSTERRKSISDVYVEMRQPLTRRQSISDLLKLYRTKSQSDLSSGTDTNKTFYSSTSYEDKPAVPITVSKPLKMSDVKISSTISKPKQETYTPSFKDIVRLRNNVSIASKILQSQREPPKEWQKPNTLYLTTATPKPYPQRSLSEVSTTPVEVGVKLNNKDVTKTDVYDEPKLINKDKKVTKLSSQSSLSSTSESETETFAIKKSSPPQSPKKGGIASLITLINEGKGFPTKSKIETDSSDSSEESSDEVDGIPHDEKVPSFIVTSNSRNKMGQEIKKQDSMPNKPYSHANQAASKKQFTNNILKEADLEVKLEAKQPSHIVFNSTHQVKKPEIKANKPYPSPYPVKMPVVSKNVQQKSDVPNRHNWVKVNEVQARSSSSERSDDSSTERKSSVSSNKKGPVVRFAIEKPRKEEKEQVKVATLKKEEPLSNHVKPSRVFTSSDSEVEDVQLVRREPKLSNQLENKALPEPEPILTGQLDEQYINVRPTEVKRFELDGSSSKSSSDEDKSPKRSRIPVYKSPIPFKKRATSSTDEEIPNKVVNSRETPATKPTSIIKKEEPKTQLSNDEEHSGSGGEQFKDFDPFAIGRMIVRGSRKSTSKVKPPENLTHISNATIPEHSPFSPLKKPGAAKSNPHKEANGHRRLGSTTSSSSDDGNLSYLNETDGVYNASVAIIN